MFLFGICALGPAAYGLANFNGADFPLYLVIWTAAIYAWEAMAEVLALAFDNPLFGMMQCMGLWFSAFLYGGFLIPGEDMVWPLKVFYYILPIKYSVRSMVWAEFHQADFAKCKGGVDPGAVQSNGEYCYGQDGTDVLDSLNNIFPVSDRSVDLSFPSIVPVRQPINLRPRLRTIPPPSHLASPRLASPHLTSLPLP
jgi:hypothetical protein